MVSRSTIKAAATSNSSTTAPTSNQTSHGGLGASGAISSNNLLSPNAASSGAGEQPLQRRKSALGGNGFFIDQSCTRRRSSAAAQQAKEQQRNRFISTYVSPVRWPRNSSFCAGSQQKPQLNNQPMSPSCAAAATSSKGLSRASYSGDYAAGGAGGGGGGHLTTMLMPGLHAPIALAGSRKTSIFDPTGHSVSPHHLIGRRKSTMVTSAAGSSAPAASCLAGGSSASAAETAANLLVAPAVVEPGAARLSSVAKSAARTAGQPKRKGALAEQHVPVIGCSPTSIRASLAALDETRRYEKLLRRLERHQRRKEKRRKRAAAAASASANLAHLTTSGSDEDGGDDDDDDDENVVCGQQRRARRNSRTPQDQNRLAAFKWRRDSELSESFPPAPQAHLSLRRKSIRAAASLLQRAAGNRDAGNYGEHFSQAPDGLSISSLSFLSARSSLPSLDRYEINNDELFIDEDTMVNFSEQSGADGASSSVAGVAGRCGCQTGGEASGGGKRAAVRLAVKRLASSISGKLSPQRHSKHHSNRRLSRQQQDEQQLHQMAASTSASQEAANIGSFLSRPNSAGSSSSRPQAAGAASSHSHHQQQRSMSIAGGLNYWYYYYYLRENSIDNIDDLPINVTGPVSEAERRSRLYINYSLARIEILNSSGTGGSALDREAAVSQLRQDSASRQLKVVTSQPAATDTQPFGPMASASAAAGESTTEAAAAIEAAERSPRDTSPISGLFDFSQSTDVSLALSTSTPTSDSDTDERSPLQSPSISSSREGGTGNDCNVGSSHAEKQPTTIVSNITAAASYSVATVGGGGGAAADSSLSVHSSLDSPASSSANSITRSRSSQSSDNRILMPSKHSLSSVSTNTGPPTTIQPAANQSVGLDSRPNASLTNSKSTAARHSMSSQSIRPTTAPTTTGSMEDQEPSSVRLSPVGATVAAYSQRSNHHQQQQHHHELRQQPGYFYSSTSSETIRSWQLEELPQQQHEAPERGKITMSRCSTKTSLNGNGSQQQQHLVVDAGSRRLHINLAAVAAGGMISESAASNERRRSRDRDNEDAVANSAAFGGVEVGEEIEDVGEGRESRVDWEGEEQGEGGEAREEELDDFERLNRAHRGYKPPPPRARVATTPERSQHGKEQVARSEAKASSGSGKAKTISARDSNLRLSVRSVRSSVRRDSRYEKGAHSRTSMSWDTLVDTASVAARSIGTLIAPKTKTKATASTTTSSGASNTVTGGAGATCSDGSGGALPAAQIEARQLKRQQFSNAGLLSAAGNGSPSQQASTSSKTGGGSTRPAPIKQPANLLPVWGDAPVALARDAPERRSLRSRSHLSGASAGAAGVGSFCVSPSYLHQQLSQLWLQHHQQQHWRQQSHCQQQQAADQFCSTCSNEQHAASSSGGSPHHCRYFDFNRNTGHGSHQQQHERAPRKSSSAPMPLPAQSGRARSHTSIVNLGMAANELMSAGQALGQARSNGRPVELEGLAGLASSSIVSRSQQQLHEQQERQRQELERQQLQFQFQQQCLRRPTVNCDSASQQQMGDSENKASPMRRCTSASLRVPKWRQSGARVGSSHDRQQQQQQQQQFGYPATCANLIKQQAPSQLPGQRQHHGSSSVSQQLEFGGGVGCINNNNTNNKGPQEAVRPLRSEVHFVRSDGTSRSNSSAQVELRTRAFSTGAGSGSSDLAVRRTSSYARVEPKSPMQQQQGQLAQGNRVVVSPTADRAAVGTGFDSEEITGFQDNHQHQQRQSSRGQQEQQQLQPVQTQKHSPKQTTQQHQQSIDPAPEAQRSDMELLGKKSFTCMLVGARQSGKRTIVKCFVKLLNEFKLAAEEYRRERMLTKLMDCSERLREITDQQQQQQQELEDSVGRRKSSVHQLYRSRMNSWLGTGTMNKLLNLPSVGKFRLNSVAGPNVSGLQLIASQQHQRRHTAVVQSYHHQHSAQVGEQGSSCKDAVGAGGVNRHVSRESVKFLGVPGKLNACNRSDSNINYHIDNSQDTGGAVSPAAGPSNHNTAEPTSTTLATTTFITNSNQLQVPGGGKTIADASSGDEPSDLGTPAMGRSVQLLIAPTTSCSASQLNDDSEPATQTKPSTTPPPTLSSSPVLRPREHSIQIAGICVRKRPLLSLKEMNRRCIKIRFKTRRQLSEKYFVERPGSTAATTPNDDRAAAETTCDGLKKEVARQQRKEDNERVVRNRGRPNDLPDSFIVVYSINDRDSFDYAKSLISQLRSIGQDTSLPIVLVANKVDLERAKEVKSEEGRTLARRNACKFLEISCTVGFNLDNLLVGIRTQLILKHHATLNSILRRCKQHSTKALNNNDQARIKKGKTQATTKPKRGDNILVRFYKRYVMENYEQNYDCDNFSKL